MTPPHSSLRLVALAVAGEPWFRVVYGFRLWGSGQTPDEAWADARRELDAYRRRGMTCRHCQRPKVNRPRGLCWTCYRLHRDLYPPTSKFAIRSPIPVAGVRLAPEPTDTLPGSSARADVMERCAEAGYALWHPGDRRRGLD